MPSKSAATLRARRAGKVTREETLDRTRLVSNPDASNEYETSKGSPMKSIVWFIVVLLLAFVTYLGLKTYLTSSTDSEIEPTVVPTSQQNDASVVSTTILPDDPIESFDNDTFWNTNSKQIQSTSNETQYVISSIKVQPHVSYISIYYELSGGSVSDFPQVTAEMLDDISLVIEDISLNSADIIVGQEIPINSTTVLSLARTSYEEQVDSYLIDLSEKRPFALYSKVEDGKKLVIMDILNIEDENSTVTPTLTTSTTPKPTTSITPTPLPPGAQNLSNEYSQNEQKIVTSTNDKSVKITKYNYFDSPDRFTYKLLLEEGTPNAVASLSGSTLTLRVSNLALDGVVGNGGSGSTDLSATGVVHVQNVEISNTDGVSTYVFTLDKARDFRLNASEDDSFISLEIKH
jgi:hypothetical protein